jgi:hypothetical protein
MAEDIILGLDAFIRSVGINTSSPHAVLLGAGASISSGIPSATDCLWEWKRSIFLTRNPGLEAQFSELSLPSVRLRIQKWLDAQRRFPTDGHPSEYGAYIAACFPIADDRRAFFQEKVRQASPNSGYQLLIVLAEGGIIESVWTPNFDGLTVKAAAASKAISPIEIGIDCQERLPRKPKRNELVCVSLHGDYRYDLLKNTDSELQKQEDALRSALIEQVKNGPLIVVGYSGRDASLMEALEAGYGQAGVGALYWCGYGDAEPSQPIRKLIAHARANGRQAYYVPSSGFDDLMRRIALHCVEPTDANAAWREQLTKNPHSTWEVGGDFQLPGGPTVGLIKSNAFLLTPPGEVYEFDLKEWPEKGKVWEYFDAATAGKPIVAAPFRKAYAFGTIDDIKEAFSERIAGSVERVPISDADLRFEDGAMIALIRRTLIRSMATKADVLTDGREFMWERSPYERRPVKGASYCIHNAAVLYLRRVSGKNYIVLKPTVRIESANGGEVPEDIERDLKLNILGYQHNDKFNAALELWRKRLLSDDTFEFPPNCGSPFKFKIRKIPALGEIMGRQGNRAIRVKDSVRAAITHAAIELSEPNLVFSNKTGDGSVLDGHPVRGIVQNRPFDYALTARNLTTPLSIAVICPARESRKLSGFLNGLQQSMRPGNSEADFLLPFDGFQNAFATTLQVPAPGDNLWVTCPEIDSKLDSQRGALQLSQNISSCLTALKAAALPNVTIVFIPTRWAQWRTFETDTERFDLHNFIKAFCVPQGIATQFLEEDTLENPLQCRIRWWLSLALYVKSMRTPWVLSSLDQDSAFVGLGMSLDRKAAKGNQVILGCSHLYNSQGQGLQFRLSKIENPVIRRKNAFMSFDDARRVGETIRQLFWESRFRLPNRVVIHKLTHFTDDERKGLHAGLSGVKEIDLLEIHVDEALRYLSSIPQNDGGFKEDGFPVKRGSLLRLDRDSALLWVHGVSRALDPRRKYYQGKRRIPAPLVIRRHSGRSDLTMIGEEILGLSKMNWNSFDLYTKLPATVETSRQIARIGSLLERFGSTSYDYRLFM